MSVRLPVSGWRFALNVFLGLTHARASRPGRRICAVPRRSMRAVLVACVPRSCLRVAQPRSRRCRGAGQGVPALNLVAMGERSGRGRGGGRRYTGVASGSTAVGRRVGMAVVWERRGRGRGGAEARSARGNARRAGAESRCRRSRRAVSAGVIGGRSRHAVPAQRVRAPSARLRDVARCSGARPRYTSAPARRDATWTRSAYAGWLRGLPTRPDYAA